MKTIDETQIGKSTLRLLSVPSGYAGVVLLDGKVVFRHDSSDLQEVRRQLHEAVAKSDPQFFGFDGAWARFLRIFRDGFRSPG